MRIQFLAVDTAFFEQFLCQLFCHWLFQVFQELIFLPEIEAALPARAVIAGFPIVYFRTAPGTESDGRRLRQYWLLRQLFFEPGFYFTWRFFFIGKLKLWGIALFRCACQKSSLFPALDEAADLSGLVNLVPFGFALSDFFKLLKWNVFESLERTGDCMTAVAGDCEVPHYYYERKRN